MHCLIPHPGPRPLPWPGKAPVLVVAHRGFSGVAPENTLAAFRKALEAGSDMIELDIQCTREGEIVAIHDDTLARTTDGRGSVFDHPLAALKALDAGSWFHRDFAGERIPTLREVLAFARDRILLNIEIKKSKHPAVATAVLANKARAEVERAGMETQVLFSSFETEAVKEILKRPPAIPTAFLTKAPWRDPDEFPGGRNLAFIHGRSNAVTAETVARSHAAGVRVMVWTVNQPEAMARFLGLGVDGIITNHPDRLRTILQRGDANPSRRSDRIERPAEDAG